MENNIENKAKFFAQYWGQNVLDSDRGFTFLDYDSMIELEAETETQILNLKPLSSITDEDATQIAKHSISTLDIEGFEVVKIDRSENTKIFISFNNLLRCKGYFISISSNGTLSAFETYKDDIKQKFYQFPTTAFDYLRSKGYALPFMGLSVEKQIEYRWVKLEAE